MRLAYGRKIKLQQKLLRHKLVWCSDVRAVFLSLYLSLPPPLSLSSFLSLSHSFFLRLFFSGPPLTFCQSFILTNKLWRNLLLSLIIPFLKMQAYNRTCYELNRLTIIFHKNKILSQIQKGFILLSLILIKSIIFNAQTNLRCRCFFPCF